MRPMYQKGTIKKLDDMLEEKWGPIAEVLATCVTVACGEGFLFDPRPYCAATNALANLTGEAASAFRAQNSYTLTREHTAIARFEALALWAKEGAENQPELDRVAAEERRRALARDEWAERRANEMREEEERAAHAKRVAKAKKEWDLAHPVKRDGGPNHAA